MKQYLKFRESCLDTSPLGFYTGPAKSDSVYTPTGGRVLAWCGMKGIHLCQVEGFGGMVFAVDPAAPPGDCIHPIAKSIPDLMGLVIACGHISLILGAYRWGRDYFAALQAQIQPDFKTRSVLRALENTYRPPEIADPYGYIAELQHAFDYTSLPLHKDYFEWCPIRPGALRWDVGLGTSFSDYCDKDKAGQELSVERAFQWARESWMIPAVYLCENGIVVDSYLEVPGETMARFRDKWGGKPVESLSVEEQMKHKLDDPLGVDARGELTVNDKPVPLKKTYILRWDPAAENDWHSRRTLEHYGLDRNKGYLLRRECFLRRGKNPPIRTMNYQISAAPVAVPGQRFVAPRPGESMGFTDPTTGCGHILTVTAQTREALDPNFLSNHPCCYTRLAFTLEPPIEKDKFSVVDSDPGDPYERTADAPLFPCLTGKIPTAGHCAVSSLRHTPAQSITWRMVFLRKLRPDLQIPLLP